MPSRRLASLPSATVAPLRCHLLIGPPASGKTTLARTLAPLLTAPGEPPALVLSTDAIRTEVFGDASVQGPWIDIQQRLQQRLIEAVAAGIPVIIDATHARRPWRLALTQALLLPAPVEWIGWWLYTTLPTCLEWNRTRERQVPEAVVQEMAAALADPHFGPSRAEGFAALCAVVPTHHDDLEPLLAAELAALDRRIRSARARETHWQLHGYSRLLDLERLLFLIRLLSRYPELDASDPITREQLEAMVSPLPSGDLAERAAAFLGRLHGECFGDAEAIRGDLAWLEANGFCFGGEIQVPIRLAEIRMAEGDPESAPRSAALGSESGAIHTGEAASRDAASRSPRRDHPGPASYRGGVHGGHPPMGDGPVFQRVMTLLRHLLHNPFDRDPASTLTLHEQLIAATAAIPGGYLPGETATLRKDLEKLLTPYGFRSANDNVRHGYALGAAVLPAPRLREIQALVQQAAGRLADPSAQPLLAELEQRLAWAGLDEPAPPLRLYARHGVVDTALVRRESLAAPRGAEAIERAIAQRRRLLLKRFSSAGSHGGTTIGDGSGEWRVWPLQLIFHHVGWYLCVEEDVIGQEHGLIRCERLDRLALQGASTRAARCVAARAMACAAAPNSNTPRCNGWSACSTTAAVSSSATTSRPSWLWPAVHPAPGRACCRRCASRLPPGLLRSCEKAWAPIPASRCAFPSRCLAIPGGITPMRPTCWSPMPAPTAIPIPWSWISPAGPSPPTSICAPGCMALARGSESSRPPLCERSW